MTEAEQIAEAYKVTAANLLKDPDDPEQLTNLFTILAAKGERTPAHLAITKRAMENASDKFIAVFNHASALMRAVQPSADMFRKALELATSRDERALTMHHLGLAHHDAGQFQAALNWYELAKSQNPAEENLGQSVAITKMASGDLSGLYDFEVKLHKAPKKALSESGIPRWKGEDLTGKTVIVGHEQGFGDTIQFIRFAPRLRKKLSKTRLVFSGHPALHRLIKDNFKFDAVIGEDGPFKADYVTSPLSLAGVLGIRYRDITGEPYLKAPPLKLPPRGKLRVGISWKGNPDYAHDNNRSMSLSELCPLFDIPGVAFYSLQIRPEPVEIGKLGLDGFIGDLSPLIKDWKDTASAIEAMDVIVTTDSANGHMAGALGKPTLLLVNKTPCWRWMASRQTTPWYKNTKLYRQPEAFQWPVDAVRAELVRMADGR